MAHPQHLRIAGDGKNAWDSWRRAHPSERADFSGTDFTVGENRDIVFSGFEFDGGADFSDTIFGGPPVPYQIHGTGPRGSPNEGTTFDCRAYFNEVEFGDRACFEARDQVACKDAAAVRARTLPERYRDLYLMRASAADSQPFHDISFSGGAIRGGSCQPREAC